MWLLAAGLAGAGEVTQQIITGAGTELARRVAASGLPVRTAPWRFGIDPRVLPVTLRSMTPDTLLHAHDSHAAAITAAASALRGTRWIATRRVVFPLRTPSLWRRADRVIAVSSAVGAQLARDGIHPDRIVVIPSAVDVSAVTRAPASGFRRSCRLAPGTFVVAVVSALTTEKGHDVIIAAAAALEAQGRQVHWLFVGDGPLRASLADEASRKGVDARIHFLGHLDEPATVLGEADLAVLASRAEGFGGAILEALALGVPVVATSVGGVPETLARGGGQLIGPDDPAALAKAVAGLQDDPAGRARMATAGRDAASHFDVPHMVQAVLRVYRSASQNVGGS